MGEQRIQPVSSGSEIREFMEAVLRDLQALDLMIDEGLIESGVSRIGAEQEFFLVDKSWRPAPVAMELLEALDDPRFAPELARFNLELNVEPFRFDGDCLSRLEHRLCEHIALLRGAAAELGAQPVITGILPTLRASDLDMDNMTPIERFRELNEALKAIGGGDFAVRLAGIDEIAIRHDSVMLEAGCTSFQVHMQVDPHEFAQFYNIAQVAIAPVLAAAVNAPLLFGRRLWKESRVPLFQQSIDARGSSFHLRERRPRVRFGECWVDESVFELYRQDVSRFRVLLHAEPGEDPFETIEAGRAPQLEALRMFTGTVYRWNRPCYGVSGSKAHLRIEMRALPAGPSVVDEVANAAFFFGLVAGLRREIGDVRRTMKFEDARSNFYAAAEYGLDAQMRWINGRMIPVRELLLEELLPFARQALRAAMILDADIERYLGIIEERVSSGRTGAQWLLESHAALSDQGTKDEVLTALTAATVSRQGEGEPVHRWERARLEEGIAMRPTDLRVEEFMTTDLFTVDPDEPVSLVARLMEWQHVRHMPVEDKSGKLVGLLSSFDVVRQFSSHSGDDEPGSVAVSSVMDTRPTTITPEMSMLDAIKLMRAKELDCLPVVKGDRLIGIITEHDFVHIVARLLQVEASGD